MHYAHGERRPARITIDLPIAGRNGGRASRRAVGLRLGSPFDGFDKLTASRLILLASRTSKVEGLALAATRSAHKACGGDRHRPPAESSRDATRSADISKNH
jgi:hypothetical protein